MTRALPATVAELPSRSLLRGLAGRQAAITLVIALVGGLLVGIFELVLDWNESRARIEASVVQSLELVDKSAAEAAYQLNQEQAAGVVTGLLRNENIAHAQLVDNFGNLLAAAGTQVQAPSALPGLPGLPLFTNDGTRSRSLLYADTGSGRQSEVGTLTLQLDAAPAVTQFRKLALTKLALRVGWALVLSFLLSLAFYILVIRPLALLTDRITEINPAAPGHHTLEIPPRHHDDEFGQLVGTMNSLLKEFQRGLDERDRAQVQLAGMNQLLESRVEERTRELKQTLAELEVKKNAAEQAVRVKAEFLATVSHELRTPMNGVLGFVELMGMTELSDEQKEYVTAIRSSGNLLLAIINDILDFSKLENGGVVIECEPFDLVEAIGDVRMQLSGRAKEKQLALSIDQSMASDTLAMGDPSRIRQVLSNLIGNAIKFTSTGSVTVRLASRDGRQRVEVTDTGIGIDPDHHDKLFVAFSQVDGSVTRRFGGTGLGLAICKRLVEGMGGRIGVDSTAGAGSTFWFELECPLA